MAEYSYSRIDLNLTMSLPLVVNLPVSLHLLPLPVVCCTVAYRGIARPRFSFRSCKLGCGIRGCLTKETDASPRHEDEGVDAGSGSQPGWLLEGKCWRFPNTVVSFAQTLNGGRHSDS
jgi:hypothetical protein